MPKSQLVVCIPKKLLHEHVIERLAKIAEEKDRSINYVAVQALFEFLDREDLDEEM